jgi:hypothetical protein
MATVTGGDSSVIAAICSASSARLPSFDTQSLAQLFCAAVKHTNMSNYTQFISSACQQLSRRIASMDGISAGCLAGALTTAAQNLSDSDACHADVLSCMVALCSRWLLPPSLTLGPQHTAFMCRCLVSSFSAVRAVVGDRLDVRGIRHRVTEAVEGIISEMNWFCVAHVELLLILMSNHRRAGAPPTTSRWLSVPRKHKRILKSTRKRMCDVTSSMRTAFDTFDNDAAVALLESSDISQRLVGAASALVCGGGGQGKTKHSPAFCCDCLRDLPVQSPGDELVKDWLLKANANAQIISWSRSLGAEATVCPWVSVDAKCACAVLRHPGCSSSCTMLVHMAVSGSPPPIITLSHRHNAIA